MRPIITQIRFLIRSWTGLNTLFKKTGRLNTENMSSKDDVINDHRSDCDLKSNSITDGNVANKHTILSSPASYGFIYGHKHNKYLYDWLELFKTLSKESSNDIMLFTIDAIQIEKKTVQGLLISLGEVKEVISPIPPYIYNFVYHSKPSSVRGMRQLRTMNDVQVINPINRFYQSVIFDMVASLGENRMLMPYTPLTPTGVMEFLKSYKTLFLLPEYGIIRKKAILVEKAVLNKEEGYHLYFGASHQWCKEDELYLYIKKMIQNQRYLVMKGIKVLKWKGLPLEARVYVQKGKEGYWRISARVAKTELFAMDSARMNNSDDLFNVMLDVLPEKVDHVIKKIEDFSKNICSYLDYYIPNLGSCYLDFVMDGRGNAYMIGFGGWEPKSCLAQLDQKDTWLGYLRRCFDYLCYYKNHVT